MKKIKFFFTALAMLWSLATVAENSVFEKYNDMNNVKSVYISKTMIEMQPQLYTRDLQIGKVAGQLEAVYIVSTMDNGIKKDMRKDIEQYVQKGKHELLMKQKGAVSRSSFYIKKKGDKVQEFVMISDGAATLKFVVFMGNLTLKDIQNITKFQSNSEVFSNSEQIHKMTFAKLGELRELKNIEKTNVIGDLEELKNLSEEIKESIDLSNITEFRM